MTKDQLRQEFIESKNVLLQFLRHPLKQMRQMPDWTWKRLFIVLIIIASGTGFLSGFLEKKIVISVLFGIIFKPIIVTICILVASIFFYYAFQIFADKTVPFRQLFTVVFFASIPQMFLDIVSNYLPPITLIGMLFTAMLLSVGFVENFQLPKKLVLRFVAAIYLIFFAIWITERINNSKMDRSWHEESTKAPEVQLGQ